MWKIEQLDLPFSKAKGSLVVCWNMFIENFKVPYVFLNERLSILLDNMPLTATEIFDVEASWEEIKKGKAKKFTCVNELLKELKS